MSKDDYKSINISEPFQGKRCVFTEPHQERFYLRKQDKKKLYDKIRKNEIHCQEKNRTSKKLIKIRPLRTQNCEQYLPKKTNKSIIRHNKHNFSSFQQRSPLNAYNPNTYSQYAEPQEEFDAAKKLFTHTSSSFNETFVNYKHKTELQNINQVKHIEDDQNVMNKTHERSSKSKKKIHFTIYQNRSKQNSLNKYKEIENTASKQTLQIKIDKKDKYYVPYRRNNQITINLFTPNESNNKNINKPNTSTNKSSTNSLKKPSPSKKILNHTRSLPKTKEDVQRDEAIHNTLLKLQNFKFVYEYLTKSQIIEMISNYRLADQPECKWIVMIIDEVFKNRNEEGDYEKYLNK